MPKLIENVRSAIRTKQYSLRTEKSYVAWKKRSIRFHDFKHPRDMAENEVETFQSYLASKRKVQLRLCKRY